MLKQSKIEIEKFTNDNSESMGVLRKILTTHGIALAATGSAGCVRSLYMQARRLNRLPYLFTKALALKDYSLGRNEKIMCSCIEAAVQHPYIRGVIAYASCLDLLSYWQENRLLYAFNNPRNVPIAVLYRGPLAKRQESPMKQLNKIWAAWGITDDDTLDITGQNTFNIAPNTLPNGFNEPQRPDYEIIIDKLCSQNIPCNILLLTPGGCKSCMNGQLQYFQQSPANIYYTRFNDVSLIKCTVNDFVDPILEKFDSEKLLIILSTAVMQTINFDVSGLCQKLKDRGLNAVYLPTTGFDKANLDILLQKAKDLGVL